MRVKRKIPGFFLIGMLFLGLIPAHAEVVDITTSNSIYFPGDAISFSGKVEHDSMGLVTIVIRDTNDDFVLLSQVVINSDNTFNKIVEINERFTTHGGYNATAFILNMTDGAMTSFDYSHDGSLFSSETTGIPETQSHNDNIESSSVESTGTQVNIESEQKTSQIAGFVDLEKDPEYYLDRYYNESVYKNWFDTNYPDLTIEEAIGYEEKSTPENFVEQNEIMPEEIFPDAEALSVAPVSPTIVSSTEFVDSNKTTEIALAIGGLGILMGAVYGVKRKVDNNTEQISINRATIKKKLLGVILSSNPIQVIQDRLARGEISVQEYNTLKKALDN